MNLVCRCVKVAMVLALSVPASAVAAKPTCGPNQIAIGDQCEDPMQRFSRCAELVVSRMSKEKERKKNSKEGGGGIDILEKLGLSGQGSKVDDVRRAWEKATGGMTGPEASLYVEKCFLAAYGVAPATAIDQKAEKRISTEVRQRKKSRPRSPLVQAAATTFGRYCVENDGQYCTTCQATAGALRPGARAKNDTANILSLPCKGMRPNTQLQLIGFGSARVDTAKQTGDNWIGLLLKQEGGNQCQSHDKEPNVHCYQEVASKADIQFGLFNYAHTDASGNATAVLGTTFCKKFDEGECVLDPQFLLRLQEP